MFRLFINLLGLLHYVKGCTDSFQEFPTFRPEPDGTWQTGMTVDMCKTSCISHSPTCYGFVMNVASCFMVENNAPLTTVTATYGGGPVSYDYQTVTGSGTGYSFFMRLGCNGACNSFLALDDGKYFEDYTQVASISWPLASCMAYCQTFPINGNPACDAIDVKDGECIWRKITNTGSLAALDGNVHYRRYTCPGSPAETTTDPPTTTFETTTDPPTTIKSTKTRTTTESTTTSETTTEANHLGTVNMEVSYDPPCDFLSWQTSPDYDALVDHNLESCVDLSDIMALHSTTKFRLPLINERHLQLVVTGENLNCSPAWALNVFGLSACDIGSYTTLVPQVPKFTGTNKIQCVYKGKCASHWKYMVLQIDKRDDIVGKLCEIQTIF